TVADAALALSVLAGPDDRDPFALAALDEASLDLEGELRGLRVGWCSRPTGGPVEPEVAWAAERTVRLLEGLGASVERRQPPVPVPPLEALVVIFRAACLADAG